VKTKMSLRAAAAVTQMCLRLYKQIQTRQSMHIFHCMPRCRWRGRWDFPVTTNT